MSPRQRELARHALGLPNQKRTSYRNYFTAGYEHVDYDDWREMVSAGVAIRRSGGDLIDGDIFHLTLAGASAAIEPGERLDPEDFPKEPRP